MPTAAVQLPKFVPPEMPRARWTREECLELERLGLLERERFELIDGELVRKVSKSSNHNVLITLFVDWLRECFGRHFVMQEPSIDPSPDLTRMNEPEPDAIVLRRPVQQFWNSKAQAADIALVVEVAVTTVAYDLGAKAALYAAAGIEDYWVLDAAARRTVVHRDPVGSSYTSITVYAPEEAVAPLAAPHAMFRLADFL